MQKGMPSPKKQLSEPNLIYMLTFIVLDNRDLFRQIIIYSVELSRHQHLYKWSDLCPVVR